MSVVNSKRFVSPEDLDLSQSNVNESIEAEVYDEEEEYFINCIIFDLLFVADSKLFFVSDLLLAKPRFVPQQQQQQFLLLVRNS
ncbi:MAG: hypothetical protein MHMPM18_002218 [Marteilia pararefringens]